MTKTQRFALVASLLLIFLAALQVYKHGLWTGLAASGLGIVLGIGGGYALIHWIEKGKE